MLEVTADSNIYVSALEFAGTPLRFLEMARLGTFRIAISDWIVGEVTRTLRTKFLWDEQRLADAMAEIAEFTARVNPPQTLNVVKDDPDDDRILECAVAAGAQFIVSGDNALLRLVKYEGFISCASPTSCECWLRHEREQSLGDAPGGAKTGAQLIQLILGVA